MLYIPCRFRVVCLSLIWYTDGWVPSLFVCLNLVPKSYSFGTHFIPMFANHACIVFTFAGQFFEIIIVVIATKSTSSKMVFLASVFELINPHKV